MIKNKNKQENVGQLIINMMNRIGLNPLPRNYHLLHSAVVNFDQDLRQAVRRLKNNPSQDNVDKVIAEYVPEAMGHEMLLKQQNQIDTFVSEVLSDLKSDQVDQQSYMDTLEKINTELSSNSNTTPLSKKKLGEIIGKAEDATTEKISASNKSMKRAEDSEKELQRVKKELAVMTRIANTDQLTGTQNRRSFDEKLESIFKTKNRTEYSLVMLDIDHFKKINDSYGHTGGDMVLKHVAQTLGKTVRSDAFTSRTGGEEFAFIIKTNDEKVVLTFCERVRNAVEAMSITGGKNNKNVKVTISLGAGVITPADTPETIYENVDEALYQSKKNGRNMTTLHKKPKLIKNRKHKNLYSKEFTEDHNNPSL